MLNIDNIPVYGEIDSSRMICRNEGDGVETGLWIRRRMDDSLELWYTNEFESELYGFCPEPEGLNNMCNDILRAIARNRGENRWP